jgi:hypothetical protein
MLRFLLRTLGIWLLAGALVAVVMDGARSIAASAPVLTPLAEVWRELAPASLDQARFAVEEELALPALWDLLAAGPLAAPAWLVLGALGLLFIIVGRRRRREPFVGASAV